MVNGRYSEIKTLDFLIGYGVDSPETEINQYLAEGWELITFIQDAKYNIGLQSEMINNYAIVGRPRKDTAEEIAVPRKDVPGELPSGLQLVIFERENHTDGSFYDQRFFAIKPGLYQLGVDDKVTLVDQTPVIIYILDNITGVLCSLPQGSMEYKDGKWVPASCVAYGWDVTQD